MRTMFPPSASARVRVLHRISGAHPHSGEYLFLIFCKFFGGVVVGVGGKFF